MLRNFCESEENGFGSDGWHRERNKRKKRGIEGVRVDDMIDGDIPRGRQLYLSSVFMLFFFWVKVFMHLVRFITFFVYLFFTAFMFEFE